MTRLKFRFDSRRAAEAAAEFVRLAGGTMDVVRLMKMLYLAERQSLEQFRYPMFGDRYVSMRHGPVVSHSYNLLKPSEDSKRVERPEDVALWSMHFERDGYMVKVTQPLPPGALSRADLAIISGVHDEWRGTDTWTMVDKLHRSLKEWKDPGSTSHVIKIEDLCSALKLSKAQIEGLREQVAADSAMARLTQR